MTEGNGPQKGESIGQPSTSVSRTKREYFSDTSETANSTCSTAARTGADQYSFQVTRLLVDILVHDIKNYNQVARLSAELIRELSDNSELANLADNLIRAIDGSTDLLERAKKLGKVLSDSPIRLYPVDLTASVNECLELVEKAHPDKKILAQFDTLGAANKQVLVLADELIGEIFSNLFSNCVRYTLKGTVPILVSIEDDEKKESKDQANPRWRISVIDHGCGIDDERKSTIFMRYQRGSKGSGLGMHIIYALVVGRYQGEIRLKNRVESDYSQGTIVEVFLPKANASAGSVT